MKLPIPHILLSILLGTQFVGAEDKVEKKKPEIKKLSLNELDLELVKKRLKKAHKNFSFKVKPNWQVSFRGTTEKWKWTKQGWECPEAKPEINLGQPEVIVESKTVCEDWIPLSFRWWVMKKGWLKNSVPERRDAFRLWKPQADHALTRAHDIARSQVEDELIIFDGKRRASEVWNWRLEDGFIVKIYISLRNQWIERIESGDWTEYIDWVQKNRWRAPEIKRIVIERGGDRISFTALK